MFTIKASQWEKRATDCSLFYWFSRCEPGMTTWASVLDYLVVMDNIIIKLKCLSIIFCEQVICQEFLKENE